MSSGKPSEPQRRAIVRMGKAGHPPRKIAKLTGLPIKVVEDVLARAGR